MRGQTKDKDDMLTAAEAKMVRRGEKQLKEGQFTLWSEVKLKLRKGGAGK